MENIENQANTDYRGQLTERMKAKYPDMNFGGEDGLEGTNSLEQAIMQALDESDAQVSEISGKLNKLSELFNTSPRAAIFMNTLASTQNPAEAIYRAYGKEAHDAFVSGDASDFIANIEAEDAKAKAEEEQYMEEKKANLAKSIEDLGAFGTEKGLDEQQQVDLFMQVYQWLQDAYDGKYPRELFEIVLNGQNYANDVETARQQGEVNGRNARINEMTKRRNTMDNLPPNLYGQGARSAEKPKPVTKTEGDFWTE